jgi:hypothetical protein
MTKACIVHFDGDPVVINAWLKIYERWSGDIKVYCNCYFDAETEPILRELFGNYPNVEVNFLSEKQTPETTNNQLLPKIKEDLIFLTEEDNFIFDTKLVNDNFAKLMYFDIVAPDYAILPPEVWDKYGRGWMRSMFFVKNSLLKKIEIDFNPRHVDEGDLDCFGYIALQLAKLDPEVFLLENHNLNPDNPYLKDYIHIRQFNSSNLGFGTSYFEDFRHPDFEVLFTLKQSLIDNPSAQWQWIKSVAFRLLFLESYPESEYRIMYLEVINYAWRYLELPTDKIIALKYYYKALL